MDPNANLERLLEIAEHIVKDSFFSDDSTEMAELVIALDEWLRNDGCLPMRWINVQEDE